MNKFRNIKSNGFDSKAEEKRYKELTYLQKTNWISNLEKQKVFTLQEKILANCNGILKMVRAVTYKCDFYYFDKKLQKIVVEDVKSQITAKEKSYKIKMKMLLKNLPQNYVFRENIDGNLTDWEILE